MTGFAQGDSARRIDRNDEPVSIDDVLPGRQNAEGGLLRNRTERVLNRNVVAA